MRNRPEPEGFFVLSGKSEIRSLTGLRGVAACLVVVYHYTQGGTALPAGPWRAFVGHGYLSVDLFFVLSGFVMALNYGDRLHPDRIDPAAFGRFLVSRLGRVYPLYAVVTLVCIALAYAGVAGFAMPGPGTILANLALVQGWGVDASICAAAWSISTEFAAYLLLPGLLWFSMARGRARPAGMLVAIVAVYAVLAGLDTGVERHGALDVYTTAAGASLLRCLAGFTLGLLAYRAAGNATVWRILGTPAAGTLAALATLAGMAVPGSDLALVPLFAILVVTLAAGRTFAARVLGRGWAHWLGIVSYSIYLVHYPLGVALRPVVKPYLGGLERAHASGLVLFAASLLVSAVTYLAIERPARDLSRRLLGRRPLPPGGTAAAAAGGSQA